MNTYTAAISSMSYFFLKTATGTLEDEMVNGELRHFLQQLAKEHEQLPLACRSAIGRELFEGEYFYGKTITEVQQIMDSTTANITGETLPEIAQFYIKLLLELGQIEMDKTSPYKTDKQ